MRRKMTMLTVILVVGALLRIVGVIRFPFEQDELYTVDEATNLFHTRLQPGIQARPVYFLLEHPLVEHLPHTAVLLRALPLLFGLIGLWAIWALARRVLDAQGALVATTLAALSPWDLYASGYARYYSLLFLLATLTYLLLPRAIDEDRPKGYLLALSTLLVGSWTHPSFAFPIAGATVAAHLVRRDGSVGWRWPSRTAWSYLWGPLIGGSIVIMVFVRLSHHGMSVTNGGSRSLLSNLRLIPAMADWMTPTVFLTGAVGAIILLTSSIPARRRFGLMALLGVMAMVVALFALSFDTSIYADYGISALPLVFVAAAGVVQWIGESIAATEDALAGPRRAVVMTVVTALLLVGTLPSVVSYLSDGTRFDYRPALKRIEHDSPSTAVLAWPIVLQRYYAPQLRSYELLPQKARLDSELARERNLWAVVSVKPYGIVNDDAGTLSTWLAAHCRLIDHYQHPRFDARFYRVELWRCAIGT